VEAIKKETVVDFSAFNGAVLAEHVVVLNEKTGDVVYGRDIDTVAPLASLVKIATILTALDYLDLQDNISFSQEAILQTGDSVVVEGDIVSVSDAISMTLVASSNDAAFALSQEVENKTGQNFIELMEKKMIDIGFEEFRFSNVTGLDEQGKNGAYGTAQDVARLTSYALQTYPDIFGQTTQKNISVNATSSQLVFPNTNLQTRFFPGLVFSKTGFTDIAKGNLVSVVQFGLDTRFVVVTLGSTFEGRFSDSRKIIDYIVSTID
jgi:D-alanyl-D-alanine carboxypeptidase (penicillin-binding protein 5/6)